MQLTSLPHRLRPAYEPIDIIKQLRHHEIRPGPHLLRQERDIRFWALGIDVWRGVAGDADAEVGSVRAGTDVGDEILGVGEIVAFVRV